MAGVRGLAPGRSLAGTAVRETYHADHVPPGLLPLHVWRTSAS